MIGPILALAVQDIHAEAVKNRRVACDHASACVAKSLAPPRMIPPSAIEGRWEGLEPCRNRRNARVPEAYRIDKIHTLLLLPPYCEEEEGNFEDGVAVVDDEGPFEMKWVELVGETQMADGEEMGFAYNPRWNAQERLLETYYQYTGPCGAFAQRFTWDGETFQLHDQSETSACHGTRAWMRYHKSIRRSPRRLCEDCGAPQAPAN